MLKDLVCLPLCEQFPDRTSAERRLRPPENRGELTEFTAIREPQPRDHCVQIIERLLGRAPEATIGVRPRDRLAAKTRQVAIS